MIIMQENCSKWQYMDTFISWNNQSLELLKKKKRKFLGGSGGILPRKILKVETKSVQSEAFWRQIS